MLNRCIHKIWDTLNQCINKTWDMLNQCLNLTSNQYSRYSKYSRFSKYKLKQQKFMLKTHVMHMLFHCRHTGLVIRFQLLAQTANIQETLFTILIMAAQPSVGVYVSAYFSGLFFGFLFAWMAAVNRFINAITVMSNCAE